MQGQQAIFVVDEDGAMRESLPKLLQAASLPIFFYNSPEAFLADFPRDSAGCLLLVLKRTAAKGMNAIGRLLQHNAMLPILVITGSVTIPLAVDAMKLGVVDFVETPVEPGALVSKVRAACELDVKRRSDAAEQAMRQGRLARLSPREREVLAMLSRGASSKQIAADVGISLKTVENHRAHIMKKTGAGNTPDLIRISIRGS